MENKFFKHLFCFIFYSNTINRARLQLQFLLSTANDTAEKHCYWSLNVHNLGVIFLKLKVIIIIYEGHNKKTYLNVFFGECNALLLPFLSIFFVPWLRSPLTFELIFILALTPSPPHVSLWIPPPSSKF